MITLVTFNIMPFGYAHLAGFANTILSTNIILTTLSHLRYYLVSINLNYLYNFGFLLGVSIFMQTISGLFLTLIYYTQLQLYSNIYVMTYDYYYGYLYRNVHILLATIVNILLLVHIFKGLLYNNLSNQIYIHYSGYVLYLLLIVISYLGYILTYGQLSYWGATVIINLLPASLATLILGDYNISSITINRYLIFHIVLTLVLYVFIIIHIFYLHQLSSQSPLPVSILASPASQLSITFQHFILKDLTSLIFLLFIFMSIALFILINLSHSMNLIPINPLSTPSHIVPEWYFLYLYSILKIIPSKMGGILTVVITILVILLLTTSNYSYNLYNTNSIAISNYNNIDTVIIIFLSYIYLSFIGLQLPIAPYLINLRYFLLYLPIPIIIISLLSTLPLNTYLSMIQSRLMSIMTTSRSSMMSSNYISLISTTNHKRIGLYYLLTGAYIAILGIILSIIIRVELYCPDNNIINMSNVSFYNYTITNHGLLMLLFIVMPIVFGAYGNYLLVLTVGLIDIIFPRINNFGWLLLILSYVLIQFGILTEYLTGTGWTLYPPLSTITSTYLISTIFLALAISGVSSLLTSVNYLLLIPYLLHISDLLLISFLITALMILYTMPVLAGAFLLATSDILLSTSYFSNYGDPVLFQHLFWWFNFMSPALAVTKAGLSGPLKTLLYAETFYNLLVHIIVYTIYLMIILCYLYNICHFICENLINKTICRKSKFLLSQTQSNNKSLSSYKKRNKIIKRIKKSRIIPRDYTQGNMFLHQHEIDLNHPFYWWLAGFIEGDGCFYSNSKSVNKSYPVLSIRLSHKDIQTLYLIKKTLGIGKVYISKSKLGEITDVVYNVYKRDHILYLINILQGKILLKNKQLRFINWIVTYNKCYNTDIKPILITDNNTIKTILETTSWYSGLIDAEGCFNIGIKKNNNIVHKFYIVNKDELELYKLISEIFFYNMTIHIKDNIYNVINIGHIIKDTNKSLKVLNRFTNLINYLNIHKLKSRKRLAYSYWLKAYNLLISGRYKSTRRGQTRLDNSIKALKRINSRVCS
jgi:quinol-cytochrome oxidoreductase complex cytochrome b subunit